MPKRTGESPPDPKQRPEPSRVDRLIPDDRNSKKTVPDRPSQGGGAPVSPPPPRKKK